MWVLSIRSTKDGFNAHNLSSGVTRLGRSEKNQIEIRDDLVSRHHCELNWNKKLNKLVLSDLKSKNGTFLNKKRISRSRELESGDQIRIGSTLIDFELTSVSAVGVARSAPSSTTSLTRQIEIRAVENYSVVLKDISEQLNIIADVDSAIRELTRLAMKVLKADRCKIVMASQFGQLKKLGFPSSITDPVINKFQLVYIRDAKSAPSYGKSAMLQGVQSAICVPIMLNDAIAGIFYLDKYLGSNEPFNINDSDLAVGISYLFAFWLQGFRLEKELLFNSMHDKITGFPNQTSFLERIKNALKISKSEKGNDFYVFNISVESFQMVNEIYGYAVGEKLLTSVARRIEKICAEKDFVARLDEAAFGVHASEIKSNDEAVEYAFGIQEHISKPFNKVVKGLRIKVWIGISFSKLGYEQADHLLRDSTTAMLNAKKKGIGQIVVFNSAMRDRALSRFGVRSSLQMAIKKKQINANYQPIVSLKSGEIIGVEALSRWTNGNETLISTEEFIREAEGTPLIYELDMNIMEVACAQQTRMNRKFSEYSQIKLFANFSGYDLSSGNFVSKFESNLGNSKIDPSNLVVEISERSVLSNDKTAKLNIEKLRDLGVLICIDDFGSGYSSLGLLKSLPIDIIKLDKSFIRTSAWEIVETINLLSQKLGLSVVVEGIESKEEYSLARNLDCDYGQGYWISRPLNAEQAEEFFAKSLE